MNDSALRKYRTNLIFALRDRDISGDRISEILAAFDAHLVITGEDPMAAFGSPEDYAATFESVLVPIAFNFSGLYLSLTIALTALVLIADGLSGDGRFGIEPLYEVLVGLGFGVLAVIAWRKSVESNPWWIATAVTGILLVLGVILARL